VCSYPTWVEEEDMAIIILKNLPALTFEHFQEINFCRRIGKTRRLGATVLMEIEKQP